MDESKRTMALEIVETIEYGIEYKVNPSFILKELQKKSKINEEPMVAYFSLPILVLKLVDYKLTNCKNNDRYELILEDALGVKYTSVNYLKENMNLKIGNHLVCLGGLFQEGRFKNLKLPYGFYIDNNIRLTKMEDCKYMLQEETLEYEEFYYKDNVKYLLYKDDDNVEPEIVEYSEKSNGSTRSTKPNPHNKDNSKRTPEKDASKMYVLANKKSDKSLNLFKIPNIFLDGPLSKRFITQKQIKKIEEKLDKLGYENLKLVRAKKNLSDEEYEIIYNDFEKLNGGKVRLYKKLFYTIDNHFNDIGENSLYMKTRRITKGKKIFGVYTILREIIK